jgi:hypothetical protein
MATHNTATSKRSGLLRWFNGWSLFTVLLVYCVVGFAQAPAGYVKIASTNGLSQIDTAVTSGQVFNYVVTATNTSGESGPSNVVTAVIPNTVAVHSVALSWTAPVPDATHGAATAYNVYREQILLPNLPGALNEVVQ